MGCATSKRCAELREEARALRANIHALEGEVRQARRERDREALARGRREAAFAAKQAEWRRERRRHREEVVALERRLREEEEGRRRALEEEYCRVGPGAAAALGGGDDGVADGEMQRGVSAWGLVEQMKAEQAQREQAVEKWKQLYLAIKSELDALILRTMQGESLCWVAEENVILEQLHRELKAKEEIVEALRSRLEAREIDGAKRDREVDILRQSLRILGSQKRSRSRKNLVRSLRWRAERRCLQPAQVTCASFRL